MNLPGKFQKILILLSGFGHPSPCHPLRKDEILPENIMGGGEI